MSDEKRIKPEYSSLLTLKQLEELGSVLMHPQCEYCGKFAPKTDKIGSVLVSLCVRCWLTPPAFR